MSGGIKNLFSIAATALVPAVPGPWQIVAVVGISLLSTLLFKPKRPPIPTLRGSDRTELVRSAAGPHQVIYGTDTVGGQLIFAESTGDQLEVLHMCLCWAGHECDQIETHFMDDVEVPDGEIAEDGLVHSGRFKDKLRIIDHLGTDDQPADSRLVAAVDKWTTDDKLSGLCYTYFQFTFDRDTYPTNLPKPSVRLRGRVDIEDPRDESVGFSDNWALCVLNFLQENHGFETPDAQVDFDSFIAGANVSDELVELEGEGSPVQRRYTLNGSYKRDAKLGDVLEQMVTAGAGAVSYTQGKWRIWPGAFQTAEKTIDESWLAGPVKVNPDPPLAQKFNAVKGLYSPLDILEDPEFPARINAAYETEDGKREYFDLNLPFTKDLTRAQRIAEIALRKSRQGIKVQLILNMRGLTLGLFETVNLSIARLGFVDKPFVVSQWAINDQMQFEVTLLEESPTSYDWDKGDALLVDPVPDTVLPNPSVVAAPRFFSADSGEAYLGVSSDGTLISQVMLRWQPPQYTPFVTGYKVAWRQLSKNSLPGGGWNYKLLDGRANEVLLPGPFIDGDIYDFRLWALNSTGAQSLDAAEINAYKIIGKSSKPPRPQFFTVTRDPDGTRVYNVGMDQPPLDVVKGGGYEIRYSASQEQEWESMEPLTDGLLTTFPFESTEPKPFGNYTFAARTVDSSGNASDPRIISLYLGDPRLNQVIYSRFDHNLAWPGDIVFGFRSRQGRANIIEVSLQTDWNDVPNTWPELPDEWKNLGTAYPYVEYTTPLIDLGAGFTFTPVVGFNSDGEVKLEMKTGGPQDGDVVGNWQAVRQVENVRYIKVRMTATGASIISQLTVYLDGDLKTEIFPDLDIATYAADNFERKGPGNFLIATEQELDTLTSAAILNKQGIGAGFTSVLISKDEVVNGRKAAEFQVYDGSGAASDAVVDVSITGPKSSSPVEPPASDFTIFGNDGNSRSQGPRANIAGEGGEGYARIDLNDTRLDRLTAFNPQPIDSLKGTFAWITEGKTLGAEQCILRDNFGRVSLNSLSNEKFEFRFRDSSASDVLRFASLNAEDTTSEVLWLISFDMSIPVVHFYKCVTGQAPVAVPQQMIYPNPFVPQTSPIDFTRPEYGIWARPSSGSFQHSGNAKYFYMASDRYSDLSDPLEMEKWYKDLAPVFHGPTGNEIQGRADMYVYGEAAEWETNRTGAGDFTAVGAGFITLNPGGGPQPSQSIKGADGHSRTQGPSGEIFADRYPAVRFNGQNAFLLLPQAYEAPGPGEIKKSIFAFRVGVENPSNVTFYRNFWGRYNLQRVSEGEVDISMKDINGTQILKMTSQGLGGLVDGDVVYGSFDMDLPNGGAMIWKNSMDITPVGGPAVFEPGLSVDLDRASHGIYGSDENGTLLQGIARYAWVSFGEYLDFTDINNRRKFYDDVIGAPAWLGPNGGLPLGTVPDIFFAGDAAEWNAGTNRGAREAYVMQGAGVSNVGDALPPPSSGAWPPANYGDKDYSALSALNNDKSGFSNDELSKAQQHPNIGRIVLRATMDELLLSENELDVAWIQSQRQRALNAGLGFGIMYQRNDFGSALNNKFTVGVPSFVFSDPKYSFVDKAGNLQPQPYGLIPGRNSNWDFNYFRSNYPSEGSMFSSNTGASWWPMKWHPEFVNLQIKMVQMLAEEFPDLHCIISPESAVEIKGAQPNVAPGTVFDGGLSYDKYTPESYANEIVRLSAAMSDACAPKGIMAMSWVTFISAGNVPELLKNIIFPGLADKASLALGGPDVAPGYSAYDPAMYDAYRDHCTLPHIWSFQWLSYSQQYTSLSIEQQVAWGANLANLGTFGLVPQCNVSNNWWNQMLSAIENVPQNKYPLGS